MPNLRSKDIKDIELYKTGFPHIEILRPCTIHDGIKKLDSSDFDELLNYHSQAAKDNRFSKFVPASGAATRMFAKLNKVMLENLASNSENLPELKQSDLVEYIALTEFLKHIEKFAFFEELSAEVRKNNYSIDELIENDITKLLKLILLQDGLNLSNLPKALIKFHRYPDGSRSAFEEHFAEASEYMSRLRLHFTITPGTEADFRAEYERFKDKYARDIEPEIGFSYQKEETDSIVVDHYNKPVVQDGKFIYHPAGHGALLENLNDLDADLIYIKNIDNVIPQDKRNLHDFYKKVLAGFLVKIQNECYRHISDLDEVVCTEKAERFFHYEIGGKLPEGFYRNDTPTRKAILKKYLNRPLRVCGMVKNSGLPGGGPFWIKDKAGNESVQIIEGAQIDKRNEKQVKIFNSATHFNPVDIVCGVRDFKGTKFNLLDFRNDEAGSITVKHKNGNEVKILELPGLWNGSMANWNTIFIEVPAETFNPVKEINDLISDSRI